MGATVIPTSRGTGLRVGLFPIVALAVVAACGPAGSGGGANDAAPQAPAPSRTLLFAIRVEPESLSFKGAHQGQTTLTTVRSLFNANLALVDDTGTWQPALAEALPQLNTDAWSLMPDGRMETTYRLRAGLAWHDGTPLMASDFAFAWRVYTHPGLGQANLTPQGLMDEVIAQDERTLLIRWARPFPDAGMLHNNFPPQPAHLLQAALDQGVDAFGSSPYWTRDYVGLGPYRLTRWEPGAFIEGEANPSYLFGRPKIDRVRVSFFGDPNVAVTTLLADEVHVLADVTIRSSELPFLRRDWIPRGAGTVLLTPLIYRSAHVQLRPALAAPSTLLDLRVRRALAHALDKQAINDAIYDGAGIMADTIVPPQMWYFAQVDRAINRYPNDIRRTEQLMAEAGYSRAADGVFTHAAQGRFRAELRTNASSQFEAEMHIIGDGWRRAGFDFSEAITPSALVQDAQFRTSFSGVYIFGFPVDFGETPLRSYHSRNIPREENRWLGSNRGGWINEEWDRLAPTYDSTLDRDQRAEIAIQLARIYSEEVPAIPISLDPDVIAHVAALRGPRAAPPGGAVAWNIHEWELR